LHQSQPAAPTQEEEAFWDDDSWATDEEGSGTRREDYKSESNEESKPSNLMKKKWSNKGTVKMKCSWKQFVAMLENLLVFHTMYKCDLPRFRPDSFPSDANELLLAMCKLVAQIIACCPHKEGHKWKLQKLYEILHFPLMMFFFWHTENVDGGTSKHHLKDVFKDVTQNSQEKDRRSSLAKFPRE
jgi:hypothetical protein